MVRQVGDGGLDDRKRGPVLRGGRHQRFRAAREADGTAKRLVVGGAGAGGNAADHQSAKIIFYLGIPL